MRDIIFFKGFKIAASVGCLDFERQATQTIIIDLEFEVSSTHAAKTDSIDDAINYDEVKTAIQHVVVCRHYDLLETLANKIADAIMQKFPIPWLKLSISKPEIYAEMEAVGITLERCSSVAY